MRHEIEPAKPSPAREREGGRWAREFPLLRLVAEDGSVDGDPAAIALSDDEVRALYRAMVLERAHDERMITLQRQGPDRVLRGVDRRGGDRVRRRRRDGGAGLALPLLPRARGGPLARHATLAAFLCNLLGNAGDPHPESYRLVNFHAATTDPGDVAITDGLDKTDPAREP